MAKVSASRLGKGARIRVDDDTEYRQIVHRYTITGARKRRVVFDLDNGARYECGPNKQIETLLGGIYRFFG